MTNELKAPETRWNGVRMPWGWTVADGILALIAAIVLVEEIVATNDMTPRGLLIPGALLATIPLAWRKSAPAAVAIAVCLGDLEMGVVSTGPFTPQLAIVPVLIALYTAAASLRGRKLLVTAGITLVCFVTGFVASEEGNLDDFWPWLLWGGAWLTGTLVRRRGDLAARLATKAVLLEVQAGTVASDSAQKERDRIARELHDVVAHSVSVMVVQAGAARLRLEDPQGPTAASLDAIEQAGRQALAELRAMLGVLRDGPAEPDEELTPLPGLADIPDLVDRLHSMGLPVELRVAAGEARAVVKEAGEPATGLELAAYRILQESLTNVVRHAGLVATTVSIAVTDAAIELDVSNAAPRTVDRSVVSPHRPGRGIVGMHERALSVGGILAAGPDANGGYTVHALLPVELLARPV